MTLLLGAAIAFLSRSPLAYVVDVVQHPGQQRAGRLRLGSRTSGTGGFSAADGPTRRACARFRIGGIEFGISVPSDPDCGASERKRNIGKPLWIGDSWATALAAGIAGVRVMELFEIG
jgi:hypothetical protein